MNLLETLRNGKIKFDTRRTNIIENIIKTTMTELKTDTYGNEYVLLLENNVEFTSVEDEIPDKTEFEAVQNHIHILDNITKAEFNALYSISETLCKSVLAILCTKYPNRHFYVYATASLHDSFILRFHQSWYGESPYYEGISLSLNEWIRCEHN